MKVSIDSQLEIWLIIMNNYYSSSDLQLQNSLNTEIRQIIIVSLEYFQFYLKTMCKLVIANTVYALNF